MIEQLNKLNPPLSSIDTLHDMNTYYKLAVNNVMFTLATNGVAADYDKLTDMLASGNFQQLVNNQIHNHFDNFIGLVVAEYT